MRDIAEAATTETVAAVARHGVRRSTMRAGSAPPGMSAMTAEGSPRVSTRARWTPRCAERSCPRRGRPRGRRDGGLPASGASRAAARRRPSTRRPCARVTAPRRSQTRAGAPVVTDLDARYSALCDAVRAHPDVPADLRAEITASGAPRGRHLRGRGTDATGPRDAAACVGRVRARGEPGTVRGDAAGEHGRRARVHGAGAAMGLQPRHGGGRAVERNDVGAVGRSRMVRAAGKPRRGHHHRPRRAFCDDESGSYQRARRINGTDTRDFVRARSARRWRAGSTRRCRYPTRSSRTSAPSWSGRAAKGTAAVFAAFGLRESRASNWRLRARSAAHTGGRFPDRRAARSAPGVQARRGGDGAHHPLHPARRRGRRYRDLPDEL